MELREGLKLISGKKPAAEFRKGYGVMGQDALDFYDIEGKIIQYQWGNGYGAFEAVDSVPDEIKEYDKL